MPTLTVDYEYDVHSIDVSGKDWSRISAGEELEIEGSGFSVEGECERDFWSFNSGGPGTLRVHCDSGRDVYVGTIEDLMIDEE